MYTYNYGLGNIWIGETPPPTPAHNIIWMRIQRVDGKRGYHEFMTWNVYENQWQHVSMSWFESNAATVDFVNNQLSLHNSSSDAHADIRNLLLDYDARITAESQIREEIDNNLQKQLDVQNTTLTFLTNTNTSVGRYLLTSLRKYEPNEVTANLVYDSLYRDNVNEPFTSSSNSILITGASQTQAGLLSAADKIKLDNLDQFLEESINIANEYTNNAINTHNISVTAHIDIRELLNTVTGLPTYDAETYKLTFTTLAGSQLVVDLPIEKMDLRYNPEEQTIEFDNGDGTISSIPVSDFVTEYVGSNGTEITVSIGTNNTINATLVNNSINWEKLSLALQEKINSKTELQLGETNDTAYAGDKGKLTTDITKSLGTQLLADSITVNKDSESITLSYNKKTRNSDLEIFISNIGNAIIPSATQEQAGVMSAADKTALDTMEFSSINLIDGSESVTISSGIQKFEIPGNVNTGDEFALSIQDITNIEGPATQYHVVIAKPDLSGILSPYYILTQSSKTAVISINNAEDAAAVLVLHSSTSGQTQGNTVRYDKIMLVRGNKPCMTWAPSVNDQKQAAIDGVQIGIVNLVKRGNYGLKDVATYFITTISLNKGLVSGNKYTLIISGNVTGRQYFGLWDSSASNRQGIATHIQDNIYSITFTFNPGTNANNIVLRLYNVPESTAPNDPCDVDWVCLYEGDVKAPYTFVPSIYDNTSSIFVLTSEDISGETVTDEIYNGLSNAIDSNTPIYIKYIYAELPILLPILAATKNQGIIGLRIDLSILGDKGNISRFNIVINEDKSITEENFSVTSETNLPKKPTQSGNAGTASSYSRGDHIHPEQTSIAGKDIATQEWVLQQLANYVSKSGDSTISGTLTATAFKES